MSQKKKNPSQDLREVRSDTKSKPRIDFSTPIEIFICELQKVKNENQDTMEYESYTKAFDKKNEAKICFQAASNGSFNDFSSFSAEYSGQAK